MKVCYKYTLFTLSLIAFLLIFFFVLNSTNKYFAGQTEAATSWSSNKASSFAGGNGTSSSPYLISTPQQLALITSYSSSTYTSTYFKITSNLDMSAHNWSNATFYGTLDGGGYDITGLKHDSGSYGGLFSIIDSATIKNVRIVGGSLKASLGDGGSIAGIARNSSSITNCYNSATISNTSRVGGIVGKIESGSDIYDCINTGSVTGSGDYVGGIVGYINSTGSYAYVYRCYNRGTVLSDQYRGGIVGYMVGGSSYRTRIEDCVNNGYVNGNSNETAANYVGGICGYASQGRIYNCSSLYDHIYGNSLYLGSYVGGILGYGEDYIRIDECFNKSNVHGGLFLGGIVGFAINATLYDCLNVGTISISKDSSSDGVGTAGGIVGAAVSSSIYRCINRGNLSWPSSYAGMIIGGIAGIMADTYEDVDYGSSYLRSCINTGSLTATTGLFIGGVIGGLGGDGEISSNYTDDVNPYAVSGILPGVGSNPAGQAETKDLDSAANVRTCLNTDSNFTSHKYAFDYALRNNTWVFDNYNNNYNSGYPYLGYTPTGVFIFDKNGGHGGDEIAEFTYYGNYPSISSLPTRTGYYFSGYTTTKNGTTYRYNSSGSPSSTYITSTHTGAYSTLYAKWTIETYTLNFNANGGSVSPASKTATYNSTATLPTPTKTGYTFTGWTYNGQTYTNSFTVPDLGNNGASITFVAQWRANNYSISYSLGIGSWGSNPKYTTNTQYDRAFEVSNPVAPTGYTFTGWTAGGANFNSTTARYGSGSNSCNYTWNGSTLVKTNHFFKNLAFADNGSVTMTANYTANVYTITLDKGSGSGGTSTIYMKYNTGWYSNISATGSPITSITKPNAPTGYNFLGYYTEPNGEGNLIINSAGKIVASNTYTASNDTLYAYYTPKINKVVYNAQGGTIEDSTIVNSNGEYYDLVEYGQAYRAKRNLYNASRSSLNYDSSKMDFTLNNGVYTLKTKSTISSMIWANFFQSYTGQYSQGVYTVVIEVTSVSMTSGQFSISLTSPYDVGSTPVDISAGTVTTGGVSSPKTYFLTMDVRDCSSVAPEYDFRSYVTIPSGVQGQISFRISVIPGKITENDYKYVSYMQTITTLKMPGAVKTGYDFRSWKTSSSGGTQINANTIYSINGNTKIYAQWQETWYKYKTTPTGKGTQLDPYIIDSAGDLAYIASQVAIGKDLTVYCRQTAPIDLSAHNWYPIGTYKYAFSGSYDGQAYQIMGLKTAATVNESNSSTVGSYVGLFGNTSGAKLSNIYVKDALVKGHTYVGGIVGYASGSTTLSNCGYSGNTSNNNIDITAVANSGALIGYSTSSTVKITDCIVFNTKLTKLDSGSATISSTVHVLNGARGYTGSSFDNWVYVSGMPTPLPKGLSWLAESIDLDTATINSLIKTWAS